MPTTFFKYPSLAQRV